MPNEGSAKMHRGRGTVSRGLIHTNLQSQRQCNSPSTYREANLRITPIRIIKLNVRYANTELTCRVVFFLISGPASSFLQSLNRGSVAEWLACQANVCIVAVRLPLRVLIRPM
ncbi:unnamed protein product [Protopolystoma xenopodis]|uniref:Uncharacterized protein n=1 Tax=Protopolystoma xenopodis TaxID=117903 RepID=A0A3S5B0F5_9PLAT|nr:unnamed protein product [Protopolystoma xenopodis]